MDEFYEDPWLPTAQDVGAMGGDYGGAQYELPGGYDSAQYDFQEPSFAELAAMYAADTPGAMGGDYAGAQYEQPGDPTRGVMGGDYEGEQYKTSTNPLAAVGAHLGMSDKQGKVDWSNPKTVGQWLKAGLGGAQLLQAIFGRKAPRGYADPRALQAQLAGPHNSFTAAQRSWGDGFYGSPINVNRQRLAAANMSSPLVGARGYAEGGEILADPGMTELGGALSPTLGGEAYLQGGHAGGQDDVIDIKAAPGEYIFDAETVSMLGDGNNERGAALLDEMRMRLREHKRAAPVDEIPPRALSPLAYLTGAPDGES